MTDWSQADRISDQIVDLTNGALARGVSPVQILAGQCLGLLSLIRTAHGLNMPSTLQTVEEALRNCVNELLVLR